MRNNAVIQSLQKKMVKSRRLEVRGGRFLNIFWFISKQCLKSRPFSTGPGQLGLEILPSLADSRKNKFDVKGSPN